MSNTRHAEKGRLVKAVKDMSLAEQLESLSADPRFKELVSEIKELSPARQEALDLEMTRLND